ncbi:MAG: universal stress protein [Saprospiraceae bacterium]
MKKILIPVDFSSNSLSAMEYGLQLAKEFGISVTLIYSFDKQQPGNIMSSVRKILEEEAQIEMRNILSDAKKIAPDVPIDTLIAKGQAANEIIETAKGKDYDLIIMGTKGASGLTEIFIGSVANRVIAAAEVPTIVVPVGCNYRSLKTVVLSLSDDLIKDPGIIEPLSELVKKTGAKLEVYHFGKAEEKVEDLAENLGILNEMTDCNVTYDYGKEKEGINARIRNFGEKKQADLICLIRRKRNFWANLFGKSVTSKQAFHSDLPLLILQNKK